MNKLSIDVGFVKIGQYLAEIQLFENLNLRVQKNLNIAFKTVQMKFLAMHTTNKKMCMDNFDPYNVFLAIATNIPQWLKTGFVVQGHTSK